MDDRVEALQIGALDVAQVFPDLGDRRSTRRRPEVALDKEAAVEAGHFVARLAQHRDGHRADVALVSGDEDLHRG